MAGNGKVIARVGFQDPVVNYNHEEAETRLVLNAKDAIQNKYKQDIVICRYTDVLLLLYHLGCTKYEVWMMSRTLKQKKGYPVHIILSKLHTDILENILGFHSQTVCDTSSSFFGISKIKTHWKQYLQEAQKLLQSLRERFEFVFAYMATTLKPVNVYINIIQFNYFSKARKWLDHLQKVPLNCTV